MGVGREEEFRVALLFDHFVESNFQTGKEGQRQGVEKEKKKEKKKKERARGLI